tara:strand:- start:314 stop:640 length:327 start_codon:yes stop_codon:yes gene_type:complete
MAKYLFQGSYSSQGVEGLVEEGGSGRVAAATAAVESLGGSVEAFYFQFGRDDALLLVDLPSNADAAAMSLAVAASGMVKGRMTPLLTPAEIDEATERVKGATYRPPGG